MENKICSACSAVNEPNYIFCVKCGNALNNPENAAQNPGYNQNQAQAPGTGYNQYNQSQPYGQPYGPGAGFYGPGAGGAFNQNVMVDSISAEEAAAYIGPKTHHYLPKFQEMSSTGSKSNFNVMLFLLSFFLLGPIAIGYWLISKKVYKAGAIICGAFTAFSLIVFLLCMPAIDSYFTLINNSINYATEMAGEVYDEDDYMKYLNEYLNENLLSDDTLNSFALMLVASVISSVVTWTFSIVLSLKANYWYKNHVVRKVNEARETGRGSLDEISAAGGTTPIWSVFFAANILLSIGFGVFVIFRFVEMFI